MSPPYQFRFIETEKDAIKDDIAALGGPQPAAAVLQPNKSPARGADLMRAWSSESRAEEPSLDELIQLVDKARAAVGHSEVIRYIEQRLNCRIEFLQPEDELAKLQRESVTAVGDLQKIATRMETLLAQIEARRRS